MGCDRLMVSQLLLVTLEPFQGNATSSTCQASQLHSSR
jgi:hypothetical protein